MRSPEPARDSGFWSPTSESRSRKIERGIAALLALTLMARAVPVTTIAVADLLVGTAMLLVGALFLTTISRWLPVFFYLWAPRATPEERWRIGRLVSRLFGGASVAFGLISISSGIAALIR